MRFFLVTIAFIGISYGCLNDSETERAEDQFRSQYGDNEAVASTPTSHHIWALVAVTVAAGFLVLSINHVSRQGSPKKKTVVRR